jgi:hypothetical protein
MNRLTTQLLAMLAAASFVFSSAALGHKASDSYLTLKVGERIEGEWHLSLRDLNDVLDLDVNGDGAITWGELRARKSVVCGYALSHLQLVETGIPRVLRPTGYLVDNHSDGTYAVVRFEADRIHSSTQLEVCYSALFDVDRLHRGLLRLETAGKTRTAVFGPNTACQSFALDEGRSTNDGLAFVHEGVWHIWTGYDHLLFLLALLLPGALQLSQNGWQPQSSFRAVCRDVLRIVTAFTLAHSMTLTLAALGWVQLPPRVVESAIAVSVLVAAVNNAVPIFRGRVAVVAFAFGLVHGFGFANALADLGLHHWQFAQALLSFNCGVELGQMAIVSALLPAIFVVRRRLFYRELVLPIGSCAIALTAGIWFAERLLDTKWLPF